MWRALFATNLAMAMGMGIFALFGVAVFAPVVVTELGLSRTQLGSLTTVAFIVAAATGGPAGRWVGVLRARTVMYVVFGVGAVAVAAMVLAQSLVWLWAAALLCGFSQSVANVITNQLVADHIPFGSQGVQIGIKQSGPPIAQTFIGFALPPLALLTGWRVAVASGIVLGLAGLVATRLIVPADQPRQERGTQGTGARVRDPAVLRLALYTGLAGLTIQAVLTYVPLYSFERVGFTATVASMTAGVVGGAGIIARIGWVRMTEDREPLETLAVLSAISFCGLLLLLASQYVGGWALWLGLLAFGSSTMAVTSVVMLAVIRTAGSEGSGRASGVVVRCLFLGGLVGALSFGALVDATESYTLGWGAVATVLFVQGALAIVWRRTPSPNLS